MPDRYGEHEEPLADWERELINSHAITRCDLCDDDGMRGIYRCDHVDHASAAQRGMAMIRAAMGWHPYCNRCGIPHAAGDCKRQETA